MMLAAWARTSHRPISCMHTIARGFAADAPEGCQVTRFEKPGLLGRTAPLIAHEKFFDFAIRDEAAARSALHRWCSKRFLAATGLLDNSTITRTHLPFWTFDTVVDFKYRGVVGFKKGGIGSKGYRLQAVPTWREERNKPMPASEVSQQVYAGSEIRPDLIHGVVVPPRALAHGSERPHATARAEPRGMGRGIAWRLARMQMTRAAEERAEALLKAQHRADIVHSLEVELEVRRVRSHAVRLPAYIFDYQHGKTITVNREFEAERHTAVVCGTSGRVGGDELISENKARVAGGAVAAASGILLDSLSHGAINLGAAGLEWVFLAGIAGTLAGVYARWLPKSKREVDELNRLRAADQRFEESRGKLGASGGEWTDEWLQRRRDTLEWFRWAETEKIRWDGRKRAEWASSLLKAQAERARERVRWREAQEAAAAQEEEEQRRAETKREKYGANWDRGRSAGRPPDRTDPLGYFQIMELSLEDSDDLTDEQVKAAFRAAAMKWHPDRHRTGKEQAADGFRKLQGAFDVLKDPAKRAQYVSSGARGWNARA